MRREKNARTGCMGIGVMIVVVAQIVGLLVLLMKVGRLWCRRSPAIGQRLGAIVAGSGRRGPL